MTATNWILEIDKFRRSRKGNMDYILGGREYSYSVAVSSCVNLYYNVDWSNVHPLICIFQAAELGRLSASMNKLEKDLKDFDKYKVFYYFFMGCALVQFVGV